MDWTIFNGIGWAVTLVILIIVAMATFKRRYPNERASDMECDETATGVLGVSDVMPPPDRGRGRLFDMAECYRRDSKPPITSGTVQK